MNQKTKFAISAFISLPLLLSACSVSTSGGRQIGGGYPKYVDQLAGSIGEQNGLREWRARTSGYLANGQTQDLKFSFPGGHNYAVLGICDGGCEEMNLTARTNGNLVAKSDPTDGYPDMPDVMMAPASDTDFDLRVKMDKCTTPSCQYTLVFYSD